MTRESRLLTKKYDEDTRTTWGWSAKVFERDIEGNRTIWFPPKPESAEFLASEWMGVTFGLGSLAGEGMSSRYEPVRLGKLLEICGVEDCREAMVLAHKRATADAAALVESLSVLVEDVDGQSRDVATKCQVLFQGVLQSLVDQLNEVGEVIPKATSHREPDTEGAEVADLDAFRATRDGAAASCPGDVKDPESFSIGRYASTVGGIEDREISVVGSSLIPWIVIDTLLVPETEDQDFDYRCLPDTYDDRQDAMREGRRQHALAIQNGGPSEEFQAT